MIEIAGKVEINQNNFPKRISDRQWLVNQLTEIF